MLKCTRMLPVSAASVAALALAGSAAATPAEGDVQRTDLAKGTTDTPISIVTNGEETAFYVQSLVLKPGASSGWHAHPGPEQSVITEGTVFVQTSANCIPVAYSAGQTVFLPAGTPHIVANRGPGDADVVVTYTLPADRTVRDDAPAACP
jgi:quercetin dioxygenase-like cupin family protein